MGFVKIDRKVTRGKSNAEGMTVRKNGVIGFLAGTARKHDFFKEKPAVELLWNDMDGVIGVKPVAKDTEGAFPIRTAKKDGEVMSTYVDALSFFRQIDVEPEKVAGRYHAAEEDGLISFMVDDSTDGDEMEPEDGDDEE